MADRNNPTEIARQIILRDPAFQGLVQSVGPPPQLRPARVNDRFAALVRSITYQLLSTKAAATIHQRVVESCGGVVSVDTVLAAGEERLRSAGLSGVKAASMMELAKCVKHGELRLERHGRMTDDDVTKELIAIRGIGQWTSHMYLMFTLARSDVWPTGDYGVRNGWSRVHGLDEVVSEKQLRHVGNNFVGIRSSLAWYCWRAVEDGDVWK